MTNTPYPSLTSDDEQARRLCALAIAFSNAKSPISSDEVHAAHYQELSDDSFRRKFSRDRIKLVECGFVIRQVGVAERDALWQADEASFADGSSLSADDALMLDVLCTQLVADPSFAYRDELRLALAKIDHAFGSLSAARLDPAQHDHGPLHTMLACMEQGRLAAITYVDAQGNQTERSVAPYGHFGLRGNLYFVCAQASGPEVDGQTMRTFRIDRVAKARQERGSFSVPEDFCVDDHVLLPFQIGSMTCTALLAPNAQTDADMLAELDRHAKVHDDGTREVAVSDVMSAARWAIAACMHPKAPAELVDAWQQVLREASQAQATPQPEGFEPLSHHPTKHGQRGRKGGSDTMRELMALVSSLRAEGATLTPASVAARLGVSTERATLLINLILTACTDTDYQLPLALAGDDGVVLSRSQGVTGRPIRLTGAEARALVAALDELGFSPQDPLRMDVMEAFAPTNMSGAEVATHVEAALSQDQNETLEACSRAISAGAVLSFSYRAIGQAYPTARRVVPQTIRRSDDLWYLDAFDFGRQAQRTFRIDRMTDIRIARAASNEVVTTSSTRQERMVGVTFTGRTMLDLLEWPRLEILGTQGETIVARLPFYGGMWLPRHLAACGALASTSDEDLAALIREVASQ